MVDRLFTDPRLTEIYDLLDGDRSDLDVYAEMVAEFGSRRVLDVGCGTGSFAVLLARRGLEVIGLDPAAASLAVARRKDTSRLVRWIHGDATALPPLLVDLAMMTGNVAQVFISDAEWANTLLAIRGALRGGGRFVFESRDPRRQAWQEWCPEQTRRHIALADGRMVETWTEVLDVREPLVTFRISCRFSGDAAPVTSESTLRFRSLEELHRTLSDAGFEPREVRDAPDRPGRELVLIAQTP